MTIQRMFFFCLGICLLLTACGRKDVHSLQSETASSSPVNNQDTTRVKTVLVFPFEDARLQSGRRPLIAGIPLLGLFSPLVESEILAFPEHQYRDNPPLHFLSEQTVVGNFSRYIPQHLVEYLGPSGEFLFHRADYFENQDAAFDIRRYDYLLKGRLLSAQIEQKRLTYGLNFVDLMDASFLVKAIGLPEEQNRATVLVEIQLIDRPTGEIVYETEAQFGPLSQWKGYYYGRQTDGLPSGIGLLRKAVRDGSVNRAEELQEALK